MPGLPVLEGRREEEKPFGSINAIFPSELEITARSWDHPGELKQHQNPSPGAGTGTVPGLRTGTGWGDADALSQGKVTISSQRFWCSELCS